MRLKVSAMGFVLGSMRYIGYTVLTTWVGVSCWVWAWLYDLWIGYSILTEMFANGCRLGLGMRVGYLFNNVPRLWMIALLGIVLGLNTMNF